MAAVKVTTQKTKKDISQKFIITPLYLSHLDD